ncbi:GH-E family nuclease [Selenomonas sp. WCT3]|uniref:HNH/ENDO VII family nuclease n=1 Tax=Selenomonas sp. WCT3 TaxID=3158785 RepID=UPI00296F3956
MSQVLGTIKQFIHGLANSAQENLSLGLSHPNEPKEWTLGYKAGRVTGDALAVIAGASEFAAGTGLEAGGMVASVGSGGALAAVGVPVSAGGLALATAGTAMAAKSSASFMASASHGTQDCTSIYTSPKQSLANKVKTGEAKLIHKNKLTLIEKIRYRRPSHFRKEIRKLVWNRAKKAGGGEVRDPLTGKIIHEGKSWDVGHKPGYEFWKHQQSAAERGISRKQFLNEYNNPNHYRPELPSSNRCHKMEESSGIYLGE